MSIKLDWEFSEAPRNDEPASPTNRPAHRSDWPTQRETRTQERLTGALARRWPLLALAVLALAAGGGVWAYAQAGWRQLNGDVGAAVGYEDQQATQGAANLLINVQDPGNADWLSLRRDQAQARQPAPLPAPSLRLTPQAATVISLTALDPDFVLADVNRQFTTPAGQTLSFTLPQFYRRSAGNGWLRSAPPGAFWGNWLDWSSPALVVRYSDRDAAFVAQVAPLLAKRLSVACGFWPRGCDRQTPARLYLSSFVGSLEYNPLSNVEVQITLGMPSGSASTPPDYFLSVPSPQIAGIPNDTAGQRLLADYLSVRLIAAQARRLSQDPDEYLQRTAQAIEALGLGSSDPGYLAAGRARQDSTSPARQRSSAPEAGQPQGERHLVYVTAPGDTLTGIAARFNTSVAAIERANGLGNPDLVGTGVELEIPQFTYATQPAP